MGTTIEWTEQTWNPSAGCNKISAGCKNCYAEPMAKRLQGIGVTGYQSGFEFSIVPQRLKIPLNRKKPTRWFVNSMSDLFHENMPVYYLDMVMDVIRQTPHHTYQILTKRAEIMKSYFDNALVPENVWLGVSVENNKTKHRITTLRAINAKVRFLSIEPLLEDLGPLNLDAIHQVIVGGESGTKARPMEKDWVVSILEQCQNQQVPFFFKQWGAYGEDGIKRSKKTNGRQLLGKEWNGEPNLM